MEATRNINQAKSYTILFLSTIFVAILVLSNLTGSKISQIAGLNFNSAIIFFPITYIISDVLTEVYGFYVARRVIWCGFFANLLIVLGLQVVVAMPHLEEWAHQKEFEVVFGISTRIFAASMLAYLVGEFVNALIIARMKIASQGKHLWYRAIGSSIVGELIDSCIFNFVALLFILPLPIILKVIFTQYFIRIVLEIVVLPITYQVVHYLKKRDKVDYYDYNTKFNPFNVHFD